jgi:hypothetical protein
MGTKISRRKFLTAIAVAAGWGSLPLVRRQSTGHAAEADPLEPRAYLPIVARSGASDIIFVHHSIGGNLIVGGNVRQRFTDIGYDFWDHHYNNIGLTLPSGTAAGYDYNIPNDDTSPAGYNAIFAQALSTTPQHPSPPTNAFSGLMRHAVILFKPGHLVSHITSDAMLEEYKTYYRNIRSRADQYLNHIFIPCSIPPLAPCENTVAEAARSRAFANWLKSAEYLNGHPNVVAFDLFDLLAEPNPAASDYNMLRASYRPPGCDSHPNYGDAYATIGPLLVDFVDNAIRSYAGPLTQ